LNDNDRLFYQKLIKNLPTKEVRSVPLHLSHFSLRFIVVDNSGTVYTGDDLYDKLVIHHPYIKKDHIRLKHAPVSGCIVNDHVYIGCYDGELLVIDTATNKIVHSY
jgi:hypothetical protein